MRAMQVRTSLAARTMPRCKAALHHGECLVAMDGRQPATEESTSSTTCTSRKPSAGNRNDWR
ncbi:hypothetical protein BAUCODRAFT_192608 [Baudoinia panamericana UAMH 10762]|uniref:Uncharacterized protein n=1 Tax=Baudoinia panamericana (strain UAMH 10762) TaxID=717646 RepID=M2M1U0_BAUPA|nr:uncharacterized protein BAUCODRAFT_192608 [Baudoinia panamericana UAMH 10762]EMD01018.1 hypothetical protein BAUCODRAFT_192608 [Baudoinia panamericana UAMH 10762]